MKKLLSIAALTVAVLMGTVVGVGVANAQGSRGLITGRVMECAPGPVVASPPAPEPKPAPLTVTLYRNGTKYQSKRVALPVRLPWDGTFSFSVPPNRYEVVSSYQHRVRWVDLAAGGDEVVTFNTFACPL
ncbi:MAG TPA: hypothetical protein VG246_05040 [Acidimicrobiales bacterium]|nr:hypothetical protein [Acidimicrobiales bacterium]